MARPALARDSARKDPRTMVLWILLTATLLYWAVCALSLPVTTWDSQVYNLGRLMVAETGGFWKNDCWFSERQVIFPWVFDAVHYPFLKLGFCESLPSFLCFLGLLIIVYKLLLDRYSVYLALWACLSLISMPTLIYQATSTKNDFIIVFLVGCWFYAIYRYRNQQAPWLLVACGLSLGFLCGAKTSGVIFAAVLFIATLVVLRRYRTSYKWFLASFAASVFWFGSTETYILSYLRYGDPVGPPAFVRMHSNRDAMRGAIANFVRYYVGNVSCGVYSGFLQHTFCSELEKGARSVLRGVGLADAGYRSDFHDANLEFRKTGADDSSDYGIFGWLAFTASLIIPFIAPVRSPARLIAAAGLGSLGLICYTIGWMPWNARFLLLPYSLFAIATIIFVFDDMRVLRTPVQRLLQASILFSLATGPMISWARRPQDLLRGVFNREELTFSEHPRLLPVYQQLKRMTTENPNPTIYLMAGSDSWVLEFLRMKGIAWRLACAFPGSSSVTSTHQQPVYVLILDGTAPTGLDSATGMQFGLGDSIWKVSDVPR